MIQLKSSFISRIAMLFMVLGHALRFRPVRLRLLVLGLLRLPQGLPKRD